MKKYIIDCFVPVQINQTKSLKWWIKGVGILNIVLLMLSIIDFLISIYVFKNGFVFFLLPGIMFLFILNYTFPFLAWLLFLIITKIFSNINISLKKIKTIKIILFTILLSFVLSFFIYDVLIECGLVEV
jgi:hypothetical protein